jgi:hypothetical protein
MYVDAKVKVMRNEGRSVSEIQEQIKKIESKLVSDFLSEGSLHEVYDAEKRADGFRHSGGTSSQAWSIAEVFRPLMEYGVLSGSLKNYLTDTSAGTDSAMTNGRSVRSLDVDRALLEKGGIDLTPANMNLQTQNSGESIKFYLDPAILEQLRNAPGFVPVIINVQPMTDLRTFLGLADSQPNLRTAGL